MPCIEVRCLTLFNDVRSKSAQYSRFQCLNASVAGKVAGCGRSICNELDVRERRGGLPESLQEFESLLRPKFISISLKASGFLPQCLVWLYGSSLPDIGRCVEVV